MTQVKKTLLASAICLMTAGTASATTVVDDTVHVDNSQVTIKSIDTFGTGCPSGTSVSRIADDGKSFIVGFDEYIAEAGPGIPRRDNRKVCQITVDLKIPNGFAFTIADVNYRGYADLDRNVTGTQQSIYYFAGNPQEAALRSSFHGPLSKNYVLSDRLGLSSLVWSSCNATAPVVIKTEVKVDNRRARRNFGLLTLDSADGKLTHKYGLMFRKC